jgi:predicted lipid-binding transport protein (Tim44 family)
MGGELDCLLQGDSLPGFGLPDHPGFLWSTPLAHPSGLPPGTPWLFPLAMKGRTHHIGRVTTSKRNHMRRTSALIAGSAALALALSPGLAEARAGDGGSFGSRGSMTYSAPPTTRTAPSSAQPMQRSMTPNAPQPGYNNNGGFAPGYQQSRGSSFTSGLLGGLIGAGIGGLLLGHGFFGGGGMGGFGFLGMLIQLALLYFLVRWLYRTFIASRNPAVASGPGIFARTGLGGMFGGGGGMAGGGGAAPRGGPPPITIGQADYQQFERLLQGIQYAWSNHDLNALRSIATPEMVGYFSEQLSDQASRGVRNSVTDVRLESGDLSQAWAEQGREYATVAMRFSMIDVTRDASGRVVDGSPTEHTTATEIWTFVRSRGGQWILSAIQQAR